MRGQSGYKLHLGCGTQRLDGWTNCDLYENPGVVDVAFDLQEPWPFDDGSVEAIIASHVLEHLPRFQPFFEEMWRCTRPGAQVQLRTPFGGCRAAWSDVTHVRPWYPESFCFLQPGYGDCVYNMQFHNQKYLFDVQLTQVIVSQSASRFFRWPFVRNFLSKFVIHFPNCFAETVAYLTPLKSEWAVREFLATKQGNIVPLQYVFLGKDNTRRVFGQNTSIGWKRG